MSLADYLAAWILLSLVASPALGHFIAAGSAE